MTPSSRRCASGDCEAPIRGVRESSGQSSSDQGYRSHLRSTWSRVRTSSAVDPSTIDVDVPTRVRRDAHRTSSANGSETIFTRCEARVVRARAARAPSAPLPTPSPICDGSTKSMSSSASTSLGSQQVKAEHCRFTLGSRATRTLEVSRSADLTASSLRAELHERVVVAPISFGSDRELGQRS